MDIVSNTHRPAIFCPPSLLCSDDPFLCVMFIPPSLAKPNNPMALFVDSVARGMTCIQDAYGGVHAPTRPTHTHTPNHTYSTITDTHTQLPRAWMRIDEVPCKVYNETGLAAHITLGGGTSLDLPPAGDHMVEAALEHVCESSLLAPYLLILSLLSPFHSF